MIYDNCILFMNYVTIFLYTTFVVFVQCKQARVV